ncbi:MAG: hypothetical protein E7566_03010 [Ruminococcaceae bacterium]|nr:hypothetical protein [Oscillospiraceae bacterium]
MAGKHFAIKEKNTKRTKSIVLSIVALMELILLVTSMTFSWFEPLSSLELEGYDFQTASVLNSHIEVGENSSSKDTTYNNVIDLTTFFDTQKEVRFSPVSSADAKNFYAVYDNNNTSSNIEDDKYRKLNKDDVNSNIIQFSFNISAPHGATDFYFTEALPIVNTDWENTYENRESSPFRFAFSDGTNTFIFRNSTEMNTGSELANNNQSAVASLNDDDTAVTATGTLSRPQEYAYYTDHSTLVSAPDSDGWGTDTSIKPLFHLQKGETKTITVSVWLEALDYECINNTEYMPVAGQEISFDIKLCSSWSINRTITVYDYTAEQWIKDVDANRPTSLFVRNADGNSDNRLYEFTYDANNHKWTGNIPIALQNCEFLWGKVDTNNKLTETWATFNAVNRGNDDTITMLGKDEACVWGLMPEDLIKIDFRDYTSTSWIINKDDLGNDVDIDVEIRYDGRILDYSMSDTPTQDQYGKNSWSCWIPNTINQVDFSRRGYKSENNYVEFNRWYGTDRNGETVYRATGGNGGTVGGDSNNGPYTLYVEIDAAVADAFYNYNRGKNPAISFTGVANRTLWDGTSDKTTISRFNYKPNQDTWPNGESELTRIGNTNTWYMTFSEKPTVGTYVTVWSRSGANNFNDVDSDMCFGVFYLFEDGTNYNKITITAAQALTSNGASNNFALLGTMSSDGSGAGGNINPEGDVGTGVWGELSAPTQGTFDSTFIHTSNVDLVRVTFTYDNTEWTMDMTKDPTDTTGRTWTTRAMPNSGVTNIKFTDSNGKTWTDPGTTARSSLRKYFYAKDTNGNSTGWRNKLTPSSGSGTIYYFKHYNTATTAMTVSFVTSEGVPFSYSLTKGSDNKTWSTNSTNIPDNATSVKYSDGTRTWTINANNSNTPYCYALDNNQFELRKTANYARIYLERNYNWSDMRIYYTGTDAPAWRGNAMIDLGRTYNSSPLYCYLVPTDAGLIIFNGLENGSTKQTVDLTSNHTTDMRVFKFSSWSSSQNKANCSNSALSASSLN